MERFAEEGVENSEDTTSVKSFSETFRSRSWNTGILEQVLKLAYPEGSFP